MASVEIQYNCGCGVRAVSLEAAVKHSDNTHHLMTVSGVIRPDTPKPAKIVGLANTTMRRAIRKAEHVVEPEPAADYDGSFDNLKKRLGRR